MYPEYLERMIVEEKELHEKWRNLVIFKTSEKFSDLDYLEKEYMIIQVEHMWNYLSVLRKRIVLEKRKYIQNSVK